jgi:hypothetical protein
MKSLLSDLTTETISLLYKECEKDKNKQRITTMLNNMINIALTNIKPYLYTIMALLILLFLMNCFQFYYYVKYVILSQQSNIKLNDLG